MKGILQSLKTGKTEITDIPCPAVARGNLLIRSSRTLVSAGTERMLVEFGKAGWIEKARQQPDKVRMVLDKMRTDGVIPTIEAVLNKLDQPLPLGYCNVGHVLEAGLDVRGYAVGERLISNGKHAEVVSVPKNLCARVPDSVSDDEAAFTVLGAIALQGIRLIQPTLGETVAVTGLGLIGLMTVQLLRAHGCKVIGIDFDSEKLALAKSFGAAVVDLKSQDPVAMAQHATRDRGVDAVIITAATKSNEPIHQAALMCRKRGRIVLVGVTGLELSRADFYEKELTFQVSCSYGPGRYDPSYEEDGNDYPVGFVRWTEQRNFEAVLDMMADGRLDVRPLISHRYSIADAEQAYELVAGGKPSLGILLQYSEEQERPNSELLRRTIPLASALASKAKGTDIPCCAVLGSGNYASAVLIPAFRTAGVRLKTVASAAGVSALHAARKFGFEEATTDTESVFEDPEVDAIVITTRHNSHARLTCQALKSGKHVFVEKPLALSISELIEIQDAWRERMPILMVGFNRRFAPHILKIRSLLSSVPGPKSFVMTVNAGAIPNTHWTQDPSVGGGRIVGEACHFIDLLRYLAGSSIAQWHAHGLTSATEDTANLQLTFSDGSIGAVHYFANGSKAFPKERLEVFVGGRVLQLDNFRALRGFGWPGMKKMNLWRQDKGQQACARAFVEAVKSGNSQPIPIEELVEVGEVSIRIAEALRQ